MSTNPGVRSNDSFTLHKRSFNAKQNALNLLINKDASKVFQASQSSLKQLKLYLQNLKVPFIYLQVITIYHDFDVTLGVWPKHII